MGKRRGSYTVSHFYAADSDPRRVGAALELWAGALAEAAMAEKLEGDTPLVRLPSTPATQGEG